MRVSIVCDTRRRHLAGYQEQKPLGHHRMFTIGVRARLVTVKELFCVCELCVLITRLCPVGLPLSLTRYVHGWRHAAARRRRGVLSRERAAYAVWQARSLRETARAR